MQRRQTILLLAFILMILIMAACGPEQEKPEDTAETEETLTVEEPEAVSPPEAADVVGNADPDPGLPGKSMDASAPEIREEPPLPENTGEPGIRAESEPPMILEEPMAGSNEVRPYDANQRPAFDPDIELEVEEE